MKKFLLIALFGAAMTLTGCFDEDFSFCPPVEPVEPVENVVLHFRLPDPVTREGDTFADDISTVTTVIYDAADSLVQSIVTDADDHAAFQGLRLALDPGEYQVVSWGNTSDVRTKFNHLLTARDERTWLDYHTITAGVTGNGDPLYYGPGFAADGTRAAAQHYTLTVDPVTGHESTLDFSHAHRRVEVYVRGFSGSDGSTTPTVRLTGLPAGLEFLGMSRLTQDNDPVTSELVSRRVTLASKDYALAPFDVFYLHLADYDIGVELLDPVTGEVIYTTKLNDHFDAEADKPEEQIVLQLLIEFIGAEVKVSTPDWDSEDVNYEWGR